MELALKILEILEHEEAMHFNEYISTLNDKNRYEYYALRNVIEKIREELLK